MLSLFNSIRRKISKLMGSKYYAKWLKNKGVCIGKNFIAYNTTSINIDDSRPSLVSIGDNVRLNRNFTLFTHDWVSAVFREVYHDFIPSSGAVTIGNNVSFGQNCMVLKNVTIGDNVFIAAGSIVTKDIPSNCIAGGGAM